MLEPLLILNTFMSIYPTLSHVRNLSYHNSTREPYYEFNCDPALVRLDIMQRLSPSYSDLYPILQKHQKQAFQLESTRKGYSLRQRKMNHPELWVKIGFKGIK